MLSSQQSHALIGGTGATSLDTTTPNICPSRAIHACLSYTPSHSNPPSPQYLKKPDGVALLRHDLQYDLLALLFNNVTYRFTPPNYPSPTTALFPTDRTWSFAELYLDAISNSSKANKSLKDKMSESTEYAVNFAKICLLINVGRINTTLACEWDGKREGWRGKGCLSVAPSTRW